MLISVRWLNRLLEPGNLSGAEAEAALTDLGFPLESREAIAGGDERLDVEVTSNRGDCLSHVGVAREIAAATGRQLKQPAVRLRADLGAAPGALGSARVENLIADDRCPLFVARVIRGVRVGPSPGWLVEALESIGQRSVNNVVDCSNYVLFEMGHPTHAFDLATIPEGRIVVRMARDGEPFAALDGRKHTLSAQDMVVADRDRAIGLAGVIGGLETSVTDRTRDVVLEAAAWSPWRVRATARRRGIRTDASHRYERYVDERTTAFASARLAEMIVEVAGGTLEDGAAWSGRAAPPPPVVTIRAAPCRAILGYDLPTAEMARLLRAIEVDARVEHTAGGEAVRCEAPPFRPDLTREIDLIEEVARTAGLGKAPVRERIEIEARPPQNIERAGREVASVLAGLGFFETVTFGFVSRDEASAWMPAGLSALAVDESRRAGEPALRPSLAPSLLRCLRANHHAGVRPATGVRLFETAAVFAERLATRETIESRNLGLLVESPEGDGQRALRELRGAVEAAVRTAGGSRARVLVAPVERVMPALAEGSCGEVSVDGAAAGYIGLVGGAALRAVGIEESAVAVGEVKASVVLAMFPPAATIEALPAFPAIERDLSLVVDEPTAWAVIEAVVREAAPDRLDGVEFVGVYRGKQVGAGKKSVTLRLRFRDPARTLRHDEVDPQVAALVSAFESRLGAALRK